MIRCPDLMFSLKNYIWLSWADYNLSAKEFNERYNALFRQEKILTSADLDGWIIERRISVVRRGILKTSVWIGIILAEVRHRSL